MRASRDRIDRLPQSAAMRNERLALMLCERVANFARMERPSAAHMARIDRLVADNLDLLDFDSQRTLIGLLAPLPTTPRTLVKLICHRVRGDVAAPFIAHSPAIEEAMALEILARHGAGAHSRAVARRNALPSSVIEALRALDDPATDRALELRQTATQVPPAHAEAVPAPADAEALAEMTEFAASGKRTLFATALADATGLSMESAIVLCEDPTSRNMLFALRFIGFDEAMATAVFSGLAGDLARDPQVQARFRQSYGAITPTAAAERVRSFKLEELAVAEWLHVSVANDPGAVAGRPKRLSRAG
ncbi:MULTISPECIES: hypothetical protein [unclassified Roseitalea]|uniref:hypothetical protein n=1 Tax=unclassified Roseitalea TaxID=2639107 RepID=UPI0027402987|nr:MULTISPECIES: hypothetical protein [unclassified Roseitalea]